MVGVRMRNIIKWRIKLLEDMEKMEQDESGAIFRKP